MATCHGRTWGIQPAVPWQKCLTSSCEPKHPRRTSEKRLQTCFVFLTFSKKIILKNQQNMQKPFFLGLFFPTNTVADLPRLLPGAQRRAPRRRCPGGAADAAAAAAAGGFGQGGWGSQGNSGNSGV